ncbi:MAG: TMAO reductase system protein TorT [Clostridia bacterium]|nr:TMAO reductase system protein TorT [Clostridia bacterium]
MRFRGTGPVERERAGSGRRFRRAALTGLLSLAVLASACGGSGSGGQASQTGGATSAGSTGGSPKTITLGLAMPAISTAFWVSMDYGVMDEAKKLGVQVIAVDAGGFDQSARQIQQIQTLVQRKVDVLLVGATDSKAVAPAVDQAVAQGIPVIGLSSLPATDKLAVKVGADHYGMGAFDAECLGTALGGQGQVAIMAGPPGVNWAQDRDQGFKETLAQKFPNIKIVAEQFGPSERNQGVTLMQDWLQAFPNLKGVFAVTDDLGAGAADALSAAGKTGQVKIATANLSQVGEQYLKDGKIACEAAQAVVQQGREAVRAAVALVRHQPYQKVIKTQAIGVTAENLATLDTSVISAPAGFRP